MNKKIIAKKVSITILITILGLTNMSDVFLLKNNIIHADPTNWTQTANNVNATNKNLIDNAVTNSKKTENTNLIQDQTQTIDATSSNLNDIENQVKNSNNNMISEINSDTEKQKAINEKNEQIEKDNNSKKQSYEAALTNYNNELAAYKKNLQDQGLNDGIDPSTFNQQLQFTQDDRNNTEPKVSVQLLSGAVNYKKLISNGYGTSNFPWSNSHEAEQIYAKNSNAKSINGDFAKITWDGVYGYSYNGIQIKKIVETFSDWKLAATKHVSGPRGITVYQNPNENFWYLNGSDTTTNYQFYDENGNLINFEPNNAYVAVGSLDRAYYAYDFGSHTYNTNIVANQIEEVQLLSAGTGIQLTNSTISNHDGNNMFSDKDNVQIQYQNGGLTEYGAFNVTGGNIKLHYHTNMTNEAPNASTLTSFATIFPLSSAPKKPTSPTYTPTDPTVTDIHYHYTNINLKLTVTTNYLQNNDSKKQEDGSKLADSTTQSGDSNSNYSTSKKDFTGWHLTSTPTNASGTLTNYDVTVNYIYDRDPETVKVKYVDEETGNDISNPTTLNGYYGLSYTSSPKSITGWTLSKTPNNTSGTYSKSNADIIYQYKRNTETVTANYLANNDINKNEFGQKLADSVTQKGGFGTNYTTSAKDILGWHLLGIPTNQNGTYQESNPDVNYIYDRDPETVTVKYVDTKGNTLAKSNTLIGYYGLDYQTYPASIDNYHLTAIPTNATGKYSNGPITVTYIYDVDPDIKEGLSNDAINSKNYDTAISNTSQNVQYNNVYHYVDKITVGGSMNLTDLKIQTNLPSDVNPIVNGGDINNQNIKVYVREDDGSLTNVTSQGTLAYQVNNKDVTSDNNKNVAIDTDKTRTLTWTPKTPSAFTGKQIITDIPVNLQPDAAKLKSYKSDNGINIKHTTQLIESNDLPSSGEIKTDTTSQKTYTSNNTTIQLPNIYTLKFYKSEFQTNDTINGKVWLKLYPNLVGQEDTGNKKLATLTVNGTTQDVQSSLSTSNKEILTNVNSSKTANNSDPTFDINLKSNQTNSSQNPVVLTKSLIKDQSNNNSISKTTYVSNDDLYTSKNTAAQYKKENTSSTVGSAPEEVETYYDQDLTNPQTETTNETSPTYVKLMEYMNANYSKTVSAKAGYGIKNDLILNYYGRHLTNQSTSDTDFEKNNLATIFSTDTDLTTANGKTSSQINDNQHELLDYNAEVNSVNDLINNVNNLTTNAQKTNYLQSKLGTNAGNSFVYNLAGKENTLDQAVSDINKSTAYVNLDDKTKSFINTVDTDTNSKPIAPKLYSMNYRFNKRLLSYENSNSNGVEYYDRNSSHVAQNDDQLMNKTDPISSTTDGGYKFYTNQWLKIGTYPTHYTSNEFGTNNFKLKADRDLNIYGRRYLTRSDTKNDGDKYDDLSIQPVISKNSNGTGTTMPDGEWSNK
jgi:hypothetical protein